MAKDAKQDPCNLAFYDRLHNNINPGIMGKRDFGVQYCYWDRTLFLLLTLISFTAALEWWETQASPIARSPSLTSQPVHPHLTSFLDTSVADAFGFFRPGFTTYSIPQTLPLGTRGIVSVLGELGDCEIGLVLRRSSRPSHAYHTEVRRGGKDPESNHIRWSCDLIYYTLSPTILRLEQLSQSHSATQDLDHILISIRGLETTSGLAHLQLLPRTR